MGGFMMSEKKGSQSNSGNSKDITEKQGNSKQLEKGKKIRTDADTPLWP
jgi:hypothetical protein